MSDATNWPSETMSDNESLGTPKSPAESIPGTNFSSREHPRSSISTPQLPIGDHHEKDVDDFDGDYVAVDHDDVNDFSYWFRRSPPSQSSKLNHLNPFVQSLSISNVDDCVAVESAFPEHERCSREKLLYRLTRCPELSFGMFTMPTAAEGQPKPRPKLIGHIISTRTSYPHVTDASMKLPPNWENERASFEDEKPIGHEEFGPTLCIHSLAVVPEHQGKQVGRTLIRSYIQRMKDAQIVKRIALIAHDHLIPFYESLGFETRGPSDCQFGGGGWFDMVMEL